jgi:hypothetical protein
LTHVNVTFEKFSRKTRIESQADCHAAPLSKLLQRQLRNRAKVAIDRWIKEAQIEESLLHLIRERITTREGSEVNTDPTYDDVLQCH